MHWLRFVLVLVATGVLARPALAGDGILEINQTCATNTGCVAGDSPGFPVTIHNEGSYLLTGNLTAGHNQGGIQISASDVTVDLNGFSIVSSSSDNHGVDGIDGSDLQNVEIRNGTVRGFFGRNVQLAGASARGHRVIDVRTLGSDWQGIDLDGSGHLVSRCTSVGSNLWGISVDGDSVVVDSVAEGNSSFGLLLDAETGYRGNTVGNNNGGNANPQLSGGFDLGGNLCGGDATCP